MLALERLIDDCRARGIKVTPQRTAIFEALLRHPGHPSADEVYQEVLQRYPMLSFATVYNTLQLLTEMGQVREVIVDELRRRYDLNAAPHQHAVCRLCHRIEDVPIRAEDALRPAARSALQDCGFQLETATVQFIGLCGSCARSEATD
ncbi:MAG: Fur family transcriptional regulator [Armatimonadota bacterium]